MIWDFHHLSCAFSAFGLQVDWESACQDICSLVLSLATLMVAEMVVANLLYGEKLDVALLGI